MRSRVVDSLAVLLEITLLEKLTVAMVAPAVLEWVFVQVLISVFCLVIHVGTGSHGPGYGR